MKKIKSNPPKTILIISIGFLFIFLISNVNWLLYISFFIGIIGLSSNKLSKFIEIIWFKIAEILSYIIPNILLSLVFFIILTPIAKISSLSNKKVNFKIDPNNSTTFINSNKNFNKKSFENPW